MTDDATAGVPSVAKEGAVGAPAPAPAGRSMRVVQRVVFPGADLDVVPLYVETNPERGAAELAAELLAESLGNRDPVPPAPTAMGVATGETQSVIRFGVGLPAHRRRRSCPGAARRSARAAGSRSAPTSTRSRPATGAGGRPWTR